MLKKKIKKSSVLNLISPVESLNICFQPQPKKLNKNQWNKFTIYLRNQLIDDGRVMVNYATIKNISCLRLVTVNFDQRKKHIDNFFDIIEETSIKILNNYSS